MSSAVSWAVVRVDHLGKPVLLLSPSLLSTVTDFGALQFFVVSFGCSGPPAVLVQQPQVLVHY